MAYCIKVAVLLFSVFSVLTNQESPPEPTDQEVFECVQDMAVADQSFSVVCSTEALAIELNVSIAETISNSSEL